MSRFAGMVVLASVLLLQGCGEQVELAEPAAGVPAIAPVQLLTLQPRDWQQTIEVYGVIEAVEEVVVGVEFAGTVTAVHFREGQRVARGDVLLELDDRKRLLSLQRARSQVDSAAAALQEARSTLKRRRGLVAKAAVSRELLENSELAVRRAAAAHDDALAGLALAQREVDDSKVLSPVDGVIGRRGVEAGEVVLPGGSLATIQVVDKLRMLTFVSERDVNHLRVGAVARISSPGVRGRVFEAAVVSVGVKADPRTGNFRVKLSLDNGDGLLRPGMTARVTLNGLLERDRLLIPDTAVVDRNRRKVVYVLDRRDGNSVAREVHPLLRATAGDALPVIDGLVAGDRLIVSGLEALVDGSAVEVVEPVDPVEPAPAGNEASARP